MTFGACLVQAFELANKRPALWLGCVLLMALLLGLERISLMLGILTSVSCLFVGVGIVAAIDRDEPLNLAAVISRHIGPALLWAAVIMLCWFVFRVVANLNAGESEKIVRFFFAWELTPENLAGKTLRQLILWLYSSAIVALIFVLLMINSFASWFSYPLMMFRRCGWSEARELGRRAFNENAGAMYKLNAFLLLCALIGMGLVPLLTPLFYMLVSTLMYVSYRQVFAPR
ncbi:hypothetical protein Q9L42_007955 [Methylomarinum sp. Ch1-1]|uniref:Transmembrane protein n=1 Tax=Methylomarinum roseum TaxID=3067653 RepID=A0AAU7NZY2_9GAMM|nr:hypothetical protein [Methylomarinum sp. Ch1-1]MDP4521846.1 hypothetical protein [Methylomarinum sp. Ch1-1]